MRKVSLSSLLAWNQCERKHYLGQTLKLRAKARAPVLGSGSAIHAALAELLGEFPGVKPTLACITDCVTTHLAIEFGADEDKYGKYVKGALNSLSLVPDWIWEREWACETPLVIASVKCGDETWQVHGRTDIWSTGADGIDLLDFKVSEANPLDLMLWSPQIRYYALGLQALHPAKPIWYKYLLLPTQGKRAGDIFAWPFKVDVAERTLADLTKLVHDYATHQAVDNNWDGSRPAYDRSVCGFCEYKPICTGVITGINRAEIMEALYD